MLPVSFVVTVPQLWTLLVLPHQLLASHGARLEEITAVPIACLHSGDDISRIAAFGVSWLDSMP